MYEFLWFGMVQIFVTFSSYKLILFFVEFLTNCQRCGAESKFTREEVDKLIDFIKTEIEMLMATIKLSHEVMGLETRSDITCGIPCK